MTAAADPASTLERLATQALDALRRHGFEQAQATASLATKEEVNIAHSQASLMRSTETAKLSLVGIAGGRRASTELAEFDTAALEARVAALVADAASVPADDAYAVSSGESARIVQGPQRADLDRLAAAASELLAFRAAETPKVLIEECFVAHNRVDAWTLTSGGSSLACALGWYETSVVCTARDGKAASSFNYTGGASDELPGRIEQCFGIADMLRETERQTGATPLGARFEGDVVLMPNAVVDLLSWLLGQVDDLQLIAGTSLYRDRVGSAIASPSLTLSSRFDGPGIAAISADGFATPPVTLLREGRLETLLPSLYGSRKTGLPHVPVAAAGGWQLDAGATPLSALVESVARGAVVGRFSMGRPAANGDFSGVIKNSFRIEAGRVGAALSETMISGNVARMLENIRGVSRERLDSGAWLLPWLRVGGLHFS